MAKPDNTKDIVTELENCGEALINVAVKLEALFASSKEEPPAKEAKPKEKVVTLEDVRTVLAAKSREGKTLVVKELLKKYGAEKLSDVKPDSYKALLADGEAL